MIIAIDFDGTCVTHEYPKIGKDIGAVDTLRALVAKGHKLILWTMRDKKEKTKRFLEKKFLRDLRKIQQNCF